MPWAIAHSRRQKEGREWAAPPSPAPRFFRSDLEENRFVAALDAEHKTNDITIYPDAQHGFFADYRPSYNQKAAEDAWPKLLAWFKKYGAAPS